MPAAERAESCTSRPSTPNPVWPITVAVSPSGVPGRTESPTASSFASAAKTTVPRGGAGTGATSRTIDAGVELTSRPGRRDVSTATATTTSDEQDELDSDGAAQADRIGERLAAHPAQHDEHEEEHRLGNDRSPIGGRPELRDRGQLDEGPGEARAGDQHRGGQGEEGEPPDRPLVLPTSNSSTSWRMPPIQKAAAKT